MLDYLKLRLREEKAGGRSNGRWFHSRQQRQRQKESQPASAAPVLPTVAEVVYHDDLLEVFKRMRREKGQAPGEDGLVYTHFSHSEIAEATRTLEKCVLDGTYQPYDYRSVFILKKSGKLRELKLRNILDRLIATALYEKTRAYWETVFLPRSYGFRPSNGMKWTTGVWPLLADLVLTVRETGLSVLAMDDVAGAFDNVFIPQLLGYHAQHVQDPALMALIEKVLRGGDATRLRGIDQGSAYSAMALNIYMHFAHDVVLNRDHTHPPWWRYADNLCYLCQSVPEAHQLLTRVHHMLGEARLSLKGEDGPPVDLHEKETKLLGFTLRMQDQELLLYPSKDYWEELREHLMEAHEAENPSEMARKVIRGWVTAPGPAYETLTDNHILTNVLKVAAKCGFRETFSWERLQQLRERAWEDWCTCLKRVGDRRQSQGLPQTI